MFKNHKTLRVFVSGAECVVKMLVSITCLSLSAGCVPGWNHPLTATRQSGVQTSTGFPQAGNVNAPGGRLAASESNGSRDPQRSRDGEVRRISHEWPATGVEGTRLPLPDYHTVRPLQGVSCESSCDRCQELQWKAARPIPWEVFAQGEYIGPARLSHIPQYRLRVDDTLEFVYRLTGRVTSQPYRLNVGDTLRIESLTIEDFDREVIIQPDGTITLSRAGQIPAAGRTIDELKEALNEVFAEHIRDPHMVVTPLKFNTTLEELRSTVDGRFGTGGQTRQARVTPEGTVQLPAIGSVPAQGLTMSELKSEIEHRYAEFVHGIEVTPILVARAPRSIYVVGEVREPGRIVLEGPTTVMQAIAMAGSWNIGAKLNHIVILRRDENWQLMATKLSLHDAFFGRQPCPAGETWLRDSDIIIVPKSQIQWTGDLIELFFTRGLYGIVPVFGSFELRNLSII